MIRADKLAGRKLQFLKLQEDLNKLQKSLPQVKIPLALLAGKLTALLCSFPIEAEPPPAAAALPRIILSESFVP